MRCKNCRKGNYDKRTDTVFCNVLGKTLLFDRENCNRYEEKPIITKIKERNANVFEKN